MPERGVFVIAEAGVNHNGRVREALKLVDAAADAGADAVKFQAFRSSELVTAAAPRAGYQKRNTGSSSSQRTMLERLELSERELLAVWRRCDARKVAFLCSAFDIVSLEFLIRAGLRVFKIPSGEITNLPYLERIGRAKRDVLLSTGLSTLAEVRTAVNVLVRSGTPKERIVVLQCHTEYPTAARDVNLRAMAAMGRACGVRVGLSDHTEGIAVAAAAVALGAVCVEKHFTLDRSQSGPDHRASLEPEAFAELVRSIRAVEEAMGSSVKRPTPRELKNAGIVRKSIVARNPITKGEVFTEKNLAVRRPGTGMSPMLWHRILGRKSRKSYRPDDTISMRELG